MLTVKPLVIVLGSFKRLLPDENWVTMTILYVPGDGRAGTMPMIFDDLFSPRWNVTFVRFFVPLVFSK